MISSKKSKIKVPFLDLKIQAGRLKKSIEKSLAEIIVNAAFIRGPKLAQFEEAFSRYHNSICIGVNSGTDALFLILKALGVKPGDEVITVPFTFVATAESILQTGAAVKFVDVDPNRYTLDPSKLENAITSRTVGIVPVHLFGNPADMTAIAKIAKKHHLWIVEDACQAHGALYQGKKVGTLGTAAAFSFYPTKNLGAFGDAGAVLTDDSKLADRIRLLRDHGQKQKYRSEISGYNSRLDDFQAAILNVKLPFLDQWNKSRREIAASYTKLLKNIPEVKPPETFPDTVQVYHQYAVKARRRDALAAFLENQGISTAVYYKLPLHKHPAFYKGAGDSLRRHHNGKPSSFPVSEQLSRELISLPMFPELTEEQVEYVAAKIRNFFS